MMNVSRETLAFLVRPMANHRGTEDTEGGWFFDAGRYAGIGKIAILNGRHGAPLSC
jgi:hypothetical protein